MFVLLSAGTVCRDMPGLEKPKPVQMEYGNRFLYHYDPVTCVLLCRLSIMSVALFCWHALCILTTFIMTKAALDLQCPYF